MTRGTDANLAFVFTTPARPADPQPGTRPAPELGRYDRIRRERAGYPPIPLFGAAAAARRIRREPIAVLADVLGRDGAELSASAIRQRNLANADHLAILHAIWTAETTAARHDRYRDLVMAALPPGHRQPLSHQARWLFRTLHAAELAGLDPAEVIRTAIAARDLAGARDIAAVLDARIRPRVHPLLPQPQGPWTERVPDLPDPDRHAYLAQIAAMMDDRTRRLGQHTAQTAPAWAVPALGPVPADPAARRDWEHKAAAIAAYREMYGYDHPDDPIGPEPSRQAPGPAGRLARSVRRPRPGRRTRRPGHARRAAVAAPRHLRRRDRLGTPPRRQRTAAVPARSLRRRPGRHPRRRRSRRRPQGRRPRPRRAPREPGRQLPRPARPLPAARTDLRPGHGRPAGMGARHRPVPRSLAIAADAELRRRHPDQKIEPLRSAEPAPVSDAERRAPGS